MCIFLIKMYIVSFVLLLLLFFKTPAIILGIKHILIRCVIFNLVLFIFRLFWNCFSISFFSFVSFFNFRCYCYCVFCLSVNMYTLRWFTMYVLWTFWTYRLFSWIWLCVELLFDAAFINFCAISTNMRPKPIYSELYFSKLFMYKYRKL